MYKYFCFLNCLLLLAIIEAAQWIAPVYGGKWMIAGMVLAAMFTSGLPSWQFYRDQSPEKEWKWRKNFFGKAYGIEAVVQLFLVASTLAVAWMFGQFGLNFMCRVMHIGTGMFSCWFMVVLVEWGWSVIFRYGPK